jgi:hypothetical protein
MKEMEKDRHGVAYRAVIRRMGQDRKLGVGWPKEFGGLGFGPIEQQIFVNEAHRADVPLPAVTLQTVGPTLQVYGSDMQKKKFLPAILAGKVHFAATPSRRLVLTWRRCGLLPSARVTSTSSMARRSSPPAHMTPTTSGWPAAPTRKPLSTKAFQF